MRKEISHFDERLWSKNFLDRLAETKKLQKEMQEKILTSKTEKEIIDRYKKSKKRLLLLDYDGTLVPFAKTPDEATPDRLLIDLLKKLSGDPKNKLVIISGRDKGTLGSWFGNLNIDLVAEHGIWIREKRNQWKMLENLSADWKEEIRPILVRQVERTPGSLVEEKGFSLAWHYRNVDPVLGPNRKRELVSIIDDIVDNLNLQILEGAKVIEIKSASVNKGRVVSHWLSKGKWDFIMAIGDDTTDEDMFHILSDKAYTIKVGMGQSEARYNLKSIKEAREFLREF